ncbi:bifunctional diaminohydroxyphosphoribosylaminopyrimidine deaminase/5-amino-6-(5-phosphoribosylamino)uracil reductase RibD [Dongshaea marina]|uniref:bifunctional diaminohydroxyphosphoribosylaminopyrimidine deaminase/5-amino-6-(5-phosphoribosylamino)uracil reductase RibD n=1 Tax=Dongshaea marina TaxID=2047966 RepID=UPI0019020127|nr:bifunctional diaminohydroxyphosphoribosylaminopyrimidine deaminase/5-amino-6-(5-phosphoribosylamino)uracil reductase RibD [Dongshaea marina]
MFSGLDEKLMARAIELARRGEFTTTPNPIVGCVIADNDKILGEGAHLKAGEPHAEVHALAMAGDRARGATAYVTLEPCSHYGRTPPCAKALIEAGIARVVIAQGDINPEVSGGGIRMLQQAGIQVEQGLLELEARVLNPGFNKRMFCGLPYVTVKMAATLDGRTALSNGESQWITSPEARSDVQLHRARSCAILSTAQTVIRDDASLNVRPEQSKILAQGYPDLPLRQPQRIIIDSQNRITPEQSLLQKPGEVWLARRNTQGGFGSQVQELALPVTDSGKICLSSLMRYLGEQQINSVWVEAGAGLAGALLEQQLVDELVVYLAPKLMGDQARGMAQLPDYTSMSQLPELEFTSIEQIGPDIKLTAKPTKICLPES